MLLIMVDQQHPRCLGYAGHPVVMVEAPEGYRNFQEHGDGPFLDSGEWEGLPTAPGVYCCRAEFWFSEGWCDGYPAPGESSWGFNVVESVAVPVSAAS